VHASFSTHKGSPSRNICRVSRTCIDIYNTSDNPLGCSHLKMGYDRAASAVRVIASPLATSIAGNLELFVGLCDTHKIMYEGTIFESK
jgi:hypothetical protein